MLKIISNASDQREVSFPRFTFVPARSTNFFFFPPECTTNSFSKIITNYEDQASPTLSIIDSFYPNNKSLNSTRNLIPSIHRESSNIDQFIIISSTKNFPRGFHPDRRKKEGKKEKKDNIPPLSVAIERDLPRFPPPPLPLPLFRTTKFLHPQKDGTPRLIKPPPSRLWSFERKQGERVTNELGVEQGRA